jgi:hypothetical protein
MDKHTTPATAPHPHQASTAWPFAPLTSLQLSQRTAFERALRAGLVGRGAA